jgi:hypothetical protein
MTNHTPSPHTWGEVAASYLLGLTLRLCETAGLRQAAVTAGQCVRPALSAADEGICLSSLIVAIIEDCPRTLTSPQSLPSLHQSFAQLVQTASTCESGQADFHDWHGSPRNVKERRGSVLNGVCHAEVVLQAVGCSQRSRDHYSPWGVSGPASEQGCSFRATQSRRCHHPEVPGRSGSASEDHQGREASGRIVPV